MSILAPRQYAGLVEPALISFEVGPVLDTNGVPLFDYASYTALDVIARIQVVRPDGTLGPVWATDAGPPTLEVAAVESARIVFVHVFAPTTPELPYVQSPLLVDRDKPNHYKFRYTFLSVGGARLFVPSVCADLYNLDAC